MTTQRPASGAFRDLAEFTSAAPPIELPVHGTGYAFPGTISGWAYLLCQRMFAAAADAERAGETLTAHRAAEVMAADSEVLSDVDQPELERELFGDQRDQLYREQDSTTIMHVMVTLAAWHALGPEAAVQVWEAPGNRPAPNRAARRAGAKPAAKSTPRRGSTSGTTSAPKATAKRSPQPASTRSGR